jgi:hypothetical protein
MENLNEMTALQRLIAARNAHTPAEVLAALANR